MGLDLHGGQVDNRVFPELRIDKAPERKAENPFRYFHSSPEVIRMAVMLYVRYPLSLRNVEDLLFDDVMWAARAREEHDAGHHRRPDHRGGCPCGDHVRDHRPGHGISVVARYAPGLRLVRELHALLLPELRRTPGARHYP